MAKLENLFDPISNQAIRIKDASDNACWLVLASLESLGRDETFKSLESLVRLIQKVSKCIIL